MFVVIFLCLLGGWLCNLFFQPITDLSGVIHSLCLKGVPPTSYPRVYQALLCGQPLSSHWTYQLFCEVGVIHLLVVSGAHLNILSALLHRIVLSEKLKILIVLILVLFVLACQCQPPLLRAFMHQHLQSLSHRKKLFIPAPIIILCSVLIVCLFNTQNFASLSLPLSWMACLGLRLSKNAFKQSLLIYIFAFPVIAQIAPLSPWTIIINSTLAPLIGLCLFPLTLLGALLPWLTPLIDPIWGGTITALKLINQNLPLVSMKKLHWSPIGIWTYCVVVHGAVTIYLHWQRPRL